MKFQKGNKLGKKFQPGHSPNPGGRPKKLLTDLVVARLLAKDHKLAKAVAQSWLNMARRNPRALRELLDRVEGKVAQPVGVSGLENLPEILAAARKRAREGQTK